MWKSRQLGSTAFGSISTAWALRGSLHCAQPLIRAFGVDDAAHASLAPYTQDSDIEALLLGGLEELAQRRPRQSHQQGLARAAK
jgi:hypothetical protein